MQPALTQLFFLRSPQAPNLTLFSAKSLLPLGVPVCCGGELSGDEGEYGVASKASSSLKILGGERCLILVRFRL